jgi:peroxiredoxin family protein
MPRGMTIEVFGYGKDDFMEGVEPVCGAAHFIEYAADADRALFV